MHLYTSKNWSLKFYPLALRANPATVPGVKLVKLVQLVQSVKLVTLVKLGKLR